MASANLETHAHSLPDAPAHACTHTTGHKRVHKDGAPLADAGVTQDQSGSAGSTGGRWCKNDTEGGVCLNFSSADRAQCFGTVWS